MKKLIYLLTTLTLAGFLFYSCGKDDDEPQPPAFSFKTGINAETGMNYINGDTTLPTNSLFMVGFNAASNSGKDFKSFKALRKFEGGQENIIIDSVISGTSFNANIILEANNQEGMEDWRFEISDNNGNLSQLAFTMTTFEVTSGMAHFTQILLGSSDSLAPNGFVSTATGNTFNFTEATDSASIIDWVYIDAGNYKHTILAPNDNIVDDYYSGIADWTVRNATKFSSPGLSSAQFDAVDNGTQLVVYAQGSNLSRLSETEMGSFNVGDVFAFVTDVANGSRSGLIKVTDVNKDYSNPGLSTITIEIKVQE
jgi:hypothetical protein